jgi:hypothetical protein
MLKLNKRLFTAVASIAILLVSIIPVTVNASNVVFSNISATRSFADAVADYGPLGASFTATSGNTLSDVQLLLARSGAAVGSVSVNLYSDSSSVANPFSPPPTWSHAPGSLIANIGTVLDSALSTSFSVIDLATSISLTPGTSYWITLSTNNSSAALWGNSTDVSGVGVSSEYGSAVIPGFGVIMSVNSDQNVVPYQMQITTIPEPSTLALLSLGLVGFAYSKRRKSA